MGLTPTRLAVSLQDCRLHVYRERAAPAWTLGSSSGEMCLSTSRFISTFYIAVTFESNAYEALSSLVQSSYLKSVSNSADTNTPVGVLNETT